MTAVSNYRVHGSDAGDWVTLSHPVGSSLDIWAGQIDALAREHRVLVYNLRGHGGDRREETSCTVDDLANDVLQLWQQLDIKRSHVVGLSLGGCVGVALAHHAPAQVQSLMVVNSRLEVDQAASDMWLQRAQTVEQQGMDAILAPMLDRWLTPSFIAGNPEQVDRVRQTLLATSVNGFAACCRALSGMHQRDRLAGLTVPTFFMSGLADKAVPGLFLQDYARQNPAFEFAEVPGPHIVNLENPTEFIRSLLNFIGRHC